jgi:hypothetical protein
MRDELEGRDLTGTNEPRLLDGRQERELHRGDRNSRRVAQSWSTKLGNSPRTVRRMLPVARSMTRTPRGNAVAGVGT